MKKTRFIKIVGETPESKVLEYFIRFGVEERINTIADIMEYAHVGKSRLYEVLNNLVKVKLITKGKIIGRSHTFNVNKKSPIFIKAKEFYYVV